MIHWRFLPSGRPQGPACWGKDGAYRGAGVSNLIIRQDCLDLCQTQPSAQGQLPESFVSGPAVRLREMVRIAREKREARAEKAFPGPASQYFDNDC